MGARSFFDTNILVYADDNAAPAKQRRALALVSQHRRAATGVVPVPLFQIHGRAAISSTDAFTYDVAEDGKRFLVNRYVKPEHIAPLNIVLNATAQP